MERAEGSNSAPRLSIHAFLSEKAESFLPVLKGVHAPCRRKENRKGKEKKIRTPTICCSTFLSFYLCIYVTKSHFQQELIAEDATCFKTQEKQVNDMTFSLSPPYTFFSPKL